MITVRTFGDVRRESQGVVALVPTMGYLHEGHLSLIEHAATSADTTVVSLFVNPTQFGDPTDLHTYPADEPRDATLAAKAGADILFAPEVVEVYPEGDRVVVGVGRVADVLEGEYRPGHFHGVATVVAKLLCGIQPNVAWFGRKDAQQVAIVRTMVEGLRIPTEIGDRPTVREPDGLALSSRNRRLSPTDRHRATAISEALFVAADVIESGERSTDVITAVASEQLEDTPALTVDYVAVADASTGLPVDRVVADCFVATAVRIGDVRLIDSVAVDGASLRVDRGIRLTEPSILYGEY